MKVKKDFLLWILFLIYTKLVESIILFIKRVTDKTAENIYNLSEI
jgi:hypothetical protein